ncbi:hypothetical protein V8B55DRAFT_1437097 [Mucor lusitanicus]
MFSAGSVSQYYTYSPFYHFVTGGTGTGKTLLIKALYETLVRQFDAGRNRDMTIPICNPLLRCHWGLPTLLASVAQSMSVVLRDVHVVIIDKISMLFGGKSLLVFGDFLQVDPLRSAAPLYSSATSNPNRVSALFDTRILGLFSVHRLTTQIMRQRDDVPVVRPTNEQKEGMLNQETTVPDLEADGRERPVCSAAGLSIIGKTTSSFFQDPCNSKGTATI